MAPGQGQGGRPKEVLRRLCRELVTERKGLVFIADVMDGTYSESIAVTVGSGKDARVEVVQVPAKARDRLYAAELLLDRGYGRPDQALQVEDERPRPTGEETVARIMALLPRVVAFLPMDRKEIARLFAERQRVELLVQGKDVRP